ncbi:DeoR family transcriptional regulator [Streptomyces spiralis]|uniref:DeoR family transcriptional regulator n=1 Tax=Streptomyces spiralis TaxID=66376 RepID=UPI0036ADB2D1
MSQPPAMTVAPRRALVRQLIAQGPTLSTRNIAAQVSVSKDTVRGDLAAIRQEDAEASPEPAASAPEPSPDTDHLTLVLGEPLSQTLAVLRAARGAEDTTKQNEAAARAAIRAMANTVRDAQQRHQGQPSP